MWNIKYNTIDNNKCYKSYLGTLGIEWQEFETRKFYFFGIGFWRDRG